MFCARAYRTISRLPPTDYGTWLRGQDLHLRRHAPNRAAEAIALTRASDRLARFPKRAHRIHTRGLGEAVPYAQNAQVLLCPAQTPQELAIVSHQVLDFSICLDFPEGCIRVRR